MATVRDGNRGVLLVVDVQVGVMQDAWDAGRIIGNAAHAVARARGQGVPVIWVQHASDDLQRDTPRWQWVPQLQPAAGEALIHKRFNSAFEETTLDAELARRGASHIVLASASSNWCIRATAHAALERGYDLTLLADAHSTATIALADGTRIDAGAVVRELNLAMTWLDYPGRSNRTATAAEADFVTAPAREP